MLVGAAAFMLILMGFKSVFDIHTMLFAATAMVIGFQTMLFAIFAKVFAMSEGLLPKDGRFKYFTSYFTLEAGLVIGAALTIFGLGASIYAFMIWQRKLFGPLDPSYMMRIVIPAVTALALGVQTIFASFFLGLLGLRRR